MSVLMEHYDGWLESTPFVVSNVKMIQQRFSNCDVRIFLFFVFRFGAAQSFPNMKRAFKMD